MGNQKTKSAQLQIRISPEQKKQIENRAKQAGISLSEWALKQMLGESESNFKNLLEQLAKEKNRTYAFAALHDFLIHLPSDDLEKSLPAPSIHLPPILLNIIAAMIEKTAIQKELKPPTWVYQIEPLKEPYFATELSSLKLHLLISSPIPFRRRNLFVDSTVGDRA